ncbi:MAG: hypothetical protein PUD15_07695 [Prevotella sp.]|nr:hypothetical protein [Prevotella sp.]
MMALSIITLITSCGDDNDDPSTTQTTSKIVGVWRDIDTSDGNEVSGYSGVTFSDDGTTMTLDNDGDSIVLKKIK